MQGLLELSVTFDSLSLPALNLLKSEHTTKIFSEVVGYSQQSATPISKIKIKTCFIFISLSNIPFKNCEQIVKKIDMKNY